MSQSGSLRASGGGGGGGITTINGDSGSITGPIVTIYTNKAANNSGASLQFVNSGTVSTLDVMDADANIFIGNNAGKNSTGSFSNNTGLGFYALNQISSGNNNVAISAALYGLTSGSANVGIGYNSLYGVVTGSNNIAIGDQSGSGFTGAESNNIQIGNEGNSGYNNRIDIGKFAVHTTAFIQGVAGVTVSNSFPVVINAAGQLSQGSAGSLESITPNDGIPVTPSAGTIPVLGQPAITTYVIYTTSTMNEVHIEDRTYLTQYIVDASTTPGLMGTFQTIQSAIDQILIDGTGITQSTTANIYVRPGQYIEDLSFPEDLYINVQGISPFDTSSKLNTQVQSAQLIGNISVGISAHVSLQYLAISGGTISYAVNNAFLTLVGCVLSQNIVDTSANNIDFLSCRLYSGTVDFSASTGSVAFESCSVEALVKAPQGGIFFSYCHNLSCELTTLSNVIIKDCIDVGNITGTGAALNITNSNMIGSISCTATTILFSNLEFPTFSGTQPGLLAASQASVIHSRYVATDATVTNTDYLIAVTSTAAPRTITLPNVAFLGVKNQSWIISDQSGGAGTNNITINTAGGNINGAASVAITANYGSLTIITDLSNYFVI